MARFTGFSSPLMLGFDELEQLLERVSKTADDGYPPYNIERVAANDAGPEALRITLAVAGFSREELEITIEDNQLVIRGRQQDQPDKVYLHRGIAARQFQRAFVLAEGIEVGEAELQNGLLSISLTRHEPEKITRKVKITARD